jgi:putative phage-type endonuclease
VTPNVRHVDQARGPGLGASMAAACLGMSPYLSPIGAWLNLKGRERKPAGMPAEWGNILEPVVRGYYGARHDVEIHVPTASMYRPDLPWLRATPDGIARGRHGTDRLVQVKTVDQRLRWHWYAAGLRLPSVPPHYRIQAVVEMAVTGLDRCDFAVLCGGNDYFEVIVERDPELEAMTIAALADFWTSLERDEPPAIDGADDWRVYFADRLPKQRTEVIAPPHVEMLLDEWKEARAMAKRAAEVEATAKNKIMAAAAEDEATTYETKHGRVLVIQAKGKAPYIKAPTGWGDEDTTS